MKRFEMIRCIFDAVYNNGEEYSKSDAIISDCTRDGLVNRVYIKKLKIDVYACGSYIDNATITCANSDYSDVSDADLRIEFGEEVPTRTILWANEVNDKVLEIIVDQPIYVMQELDAGEIEANCKLAGFDDISTESYSFVENYNGKEKKIQTLRLIMSK